MNTTVPSTFNLRLNNGGKAQQFIPASQLSTCKSATLTAAAHSLNSRGSTVSGLTQIIFAFPGAQMRLPQHSLGREPSASAGAPQLTARSPSAAQVGGGGIFSFAVQVTFLGMMKLSAKGHAKVETS